MIHRLLSAVTVILEGIAKLLAAKGNTVQSKEGQAIDTGGNAEVEVPGNVEKSPFYSHVPWCYACRQGLGKEHDPSDQLCIDGLPEV